MTLMWPPCCKSSSSGFQKGIVLAESVGNALLGTRVYLPTRIQSLKSFVLKKYFNNSSWYRSAQHSGKSDRVTVLCSASVSWGERRPSRAMLISQHSLPLADNSCSWSWRACLLNAEWNPSQKTLKWSNLWGAGSVHSCGDQNLS